MKIRQCLFFLLVVSIFLSSSLMTTLASQNQNGWQVGGVYSWESYLNVVSTTNLDSKTQNTSQCNIYTDSYKITSDNATSKQIIYSNNNGGVPNEAGYDYSIGSTASKLGQMFIPIPVIDKNNQTVLYSFYASRPYFFSEFDPIAYKNNLNQTWLNNKHIMVTFWNGSAQIPYSVGEFMANITSMKINGQAPEEGINAITALSRNFKFEFDLTKGFKMPSRNYADYNVTVEKKVYNVEFGIDNNGFLDHFKVDNYLVKNNSDGYGVNYEYHLYQKFNKLDFLASCEGFIVYPTSDSTINFIFGFVVGIVCIILVQNGRKRYKQQQLKEQYKRLQEKEQ